MHVCVCACVCYQIGRLFFTTPFLPLTPKNLHHRPPVPIGRYSSCAGGRLPPAGLGATELYIIDLRVEANKNRRTVKTRTPVPWHCISVPGDTRSPSVRPPRSVLIFLVVRRITVIYYNVITIKTLFSPNFVFFFFF